jgi:hypothetical protein
MSFRETEVRVWVAFVVVTHLRPNVALA